MRERIQLEETDFLLVLDVQNDFCTGGALPVPDGESIVPLVNRLADMFRHVGFTQDWHPRGHMSFVSSHPGHEPFDVIGVSYGDQILWPDHCVAGTKGAEFHPELHTARAQIVIRKGFHVGIDSYSAFYENDHQTRTGLTGYLRDRGFHRVILAGLATDFCVLYTALDARRDGFETVVVDDAVRGIDIQGSLDEAWTKMAEANVTRVSVEDVIIS
jgi:nicotinamidase/pyrazinamidase